MLKNGVGLLIQLLLYISYVESENCGQIISGLHGYFSTPNYPAVYPNDLKCKWNISVPNGYYMMLNFTQFELEWETKCGFDFVLVRSKNGTFGKFCGQRNLVEPPKPELPPKQPLMIHSNDIEVELETDFSNDVEVHGFEAHFAAIDVDECANDNGGCNHFCHNFIGGYYCSCKIGYRLRKDMKTCIVQCRQMLLKKPSGYIQSPEYPMNYPSRIQCDWHIAAERGYRVNIQFEDFHIEDHYDSLCPYDKLLMEDEKSKMGPFCGKTPPKRYESSSNWLIVEFVSDVSQGARGFKAKYWLQPVKCPKLIAPHNGVIKGLTNYTYKEEANIACSEGYEYVKGDVKRTCLANGTWSGMTGICKRIECKAPIIYTDAFLSGYEGPHYLNSVIELYCPFSYDLIGPKKIVCQANKTWSSTDLYCKKTCGKSWSRRPEVEDCKNGRYRSKSQTVFQPWIVALKKDGKLFCSGVLINKEWVLTAGHCLLNAKERYGIPGKIEVVLGAFHWNEGAHEEMKVRKIKKTVFHRRFDYAFKSDVILIQLDSPVAADSRYIQPICLPFGKEQKELFKSRKMVATVGWKMDGPTYLTDRCVKITSKNKCSKNIKTSLTAVHKLFKRGPLHPIQPSMLCTEATKGSNDFCNLPPGSPLVAFDNVSKKWYLGGLLSWGTDDVPSCKQITRKVDFFSDINGYIDWIKENTFIDLKYPDHVSRSTKHEK